MAAPDLTRALDRDESSPRPLPADVGELLASLRAPARLAAHLRLVHDVARQLTEQLNASFPALIFDRDGGRAERGAACQLLLGQSGSQPVPTQHVAQHGIPRFRYSRCRRVLPAGRVPC